MKFKSIELPLWFCKTDLVFSVCKVRCFLPHRWLGLKKSARGPTTLWGPHIRKCSRSPWLTAPVPRWVAPVLVSSVLSVLGGRTSGDHAGPRLLGNMPFLSPQDAELSWFYFLWTPAHYQPQGRVPWLAFCSFVLSSGILLVQVRSLLWLTHFHSVSWENEVVLRMR